MVESLRVPATKVPTFLNRTAVAGFGLGLVFVGPVLALLPAAIGAYLGYSEMSDAVTNGKEVEKPGLLKKEAIKDGLIGAGLASLAVGIVALAGLIAMGGMGALIGGGASLTVGVATIATVVAAPLIGFMVGAYHGKSRMAQEWAQAEAYVLERGEHRAPAQQRTREHGVAQEQEVSYKNSVSAAEEQALQERMRHNDKDFAAMHLEEKLQAAQAENSR